MKKGFDNEKYLKIQKKQIIDRISMFEDRLYLEMGGKLFDDLHASRILPGFEPDVKIKLLTSMKEKVEIVICISANDIEKNRIRADLGLSYDNEVLRLVDNFRALGLYVSSIVITLFKEQRSAIKFASKLENRGEKVYFHRYTKGYPTDVNTIVSEEGYGANPYIKTTKPLVVITAPGPNSGKLATCLSQLYHEYKQGKNHGYAKFETFPVWNLPLKHPINVAYESATADIADINMIDPYHFQKYGDLTVNYNRDIAVFPVLKNILKKIMGKDIYHSPTDMGVNMIREGIIDNEICKQASKEEIVRRFYKYSCEFKKGNSSAAAVDRVELLMNEMNLTKNFLPVVTEAKKISSECDKPCITIQTENNKFITGKTKNLLSAAGAVILNVLKEFANIDDKDCLISKEILTPILKLKTQILDEKTTSLSLENVLIALSICAASDKKAELCLNQIPKLKGLKAHSTFILSKSDEKTLNSLGIFLTSDPKFSKTTLFI